MMKESDITRSRERSQEAENRRTQVFEASTARESSQFERVVIKTASDNENISATVKQVIHQANSASRRDRDQRARGSRGASNRARERSERGSRDERDSRTRDRGSAARDERSDETSQIDHMKNVLNAK